MSFTYPGENFGMLLALTMSCDAEMPVQAMMRVNEAAGFDSPAGLPAVSGRVPVIMHEDKLPNDGVFSTIVPVDEQTLLCTTHSLPETAYLYSREKGFFRSAILGGQTCGAVAFKDRIQIALFKGQVESYDLELNLVKTVDLHTLFPKLGPVTISNICTMPDGRMLLSLNNGRSSLAVVPGGGKPEGALLFHEPFLRNSNYVWIDAGIVLATTRVPYAVLSVHLDCDKGLARLGRVARLASFPLNIWPLQEMILVSQKNCLTIFDRAFRCMATLTQDCLPDLFQPSPWPFIASLKGDRRGLVWIAFRGGSRLCQADFSPLLEHHDGE